MRWRVQERRIAPHFPSRPPLCTSACTPPCARGNDLRVPCRLIVRLSGCPAHPVKRGAEDPAVPSSADCAYVASRSSLPHRCDYGPIEHSRFLRDHILPPAVRAEELSDDFGGCSCSTSRSGNGDVGVDDIIQSLASAHPASRSDTVSYNTCCSLTRPGNAWLSCQEEFLHRTRTGISRPKVRASP